MNSIIRWRLLWLVLPWFALSAIGAEVSRPNIVVIYTDDQGYGDMTALNPQSKIPTPKARVLVRAPTPPGTTKIALGEPDPWQLRLILRMVREKKGTLLLDVGAKDGALEIRNMDRKGIVVATESWTELMTIWWDHPRTPDNKKLPGHEILQEALRSSGKYWCPELLGSGSSEAKKRRAGQPSHPKRTPAQQDNEYEDVPKT